MINWPQAVGRVIFNRIVLEAEALAPTPEVDEFFIDGFSAPDFVA